MKLSTICTNTNKLTNTYKTVNDKLVRGKALLNPFTIYQLKKCGINQIIDLRNINFDIISYLIERLFCKILNIKYFNFEYSFYFNNQLPSDAFFKTLNCTVNNNTQGKTYIHCHKGKHRTGICIAAYEMEHSNKSFYDIMSNLIQNDFDNIEGYKNGNKLLQYKYKKYKMMLEKFADKYSPVKNTRTS